MLHRCDPVHAALALSQIFPRRGQAAARSSAQHSEDVTFGLVHRRGSFELFARQQAGRAWTTLGSVDLHLDEGDAPPPPWSAGLSSIARAAAAEPGAFWADAPGGDGTVTIALWAGPDGASKAMSFTSRRGAAASHVWIAVEQAPLGIPARRREPVSQV